MSLAPGTSVGRYRIVAVLGAGGMGEVYRALDTRLKREVALKVLPAGLLGDPDRRRRFLLEAEATAALSHPRVAAIYDADDADGVCYLAMELVAGAPLTERLRSGALPLAEALTLALEVAEGLGCAHAKGILHRDLKPANVLLDAGGHAKLIDFGLAKLCDQGSGETTTGMATADGRVLGTAAYMAPEQARGLPVDVRTDIFSFGLLLYELLTGRRPFDRGSWPDSVAAVLRDPVPPLSAPGLTGESAGLAQRLLDRCLAKDAAGRPASMAEVLSDLAAIRAMTPAGSGDDASPTRRLGAEQASIVVLPLENLSPDPDNAFFADGLTEELIADLSKVKALRVISRTSAMRYRSTTKSVPEIAAELKVGHVLEGSVRRAGNNFRITAQLIEAATDAHLWAEKYTGTLDDVFDMQEKVSRAIVDALRIQLTKQESRRLDQRPAMDAAAYDYYLRATVEARRCDGASATRAVLLVDEGLRHHPRNASLLACKAYAHFQRVNAGGGTDEDLEIADTLAREALCALPDAPLPHAVLGLVSAMRPGQLPTAIHHLREAVRLDPCDTDALLWLSAFVSLIGRYDEGTRLSAKMVALSPLEWTSYMGQYVVHFHFARFAQALAIADQMRRLSPDDEVPWMLRMHPLLGLGRSDEAAALAAWATPHEGSFMKRMTLVAWRAHAGEREETLALLTADFLEACRRDFNYSVNVAEAYAQVGESASALDWVDNAIRMGFFNHEYLSQRDIFLAPLRGDPRFDALMDLAREKERAFDAS